MTEGQVKKKISKLAIASGWCVIGGLSCMVLGVFLGILIEPPQDIFQMIFQIGAIAIFISGPIAIAALIHTLLTQKSYSGLWLSIGVIVLWLIFIFLLTLSIGMAEPLAARLVCGTNIKGLGVAMFEYADENNGLHTEKDWCDLLMSEADVEYKNFICPYTDCEKGQSSYSMNIEATGKKYMELPGDLVLLFESGPGWNQIGGKELLSLDNHDGHGCNVVFADGHNEYVKAANIDKLRWTVEEE